MKELFSKIYNDFLFLRNFSREIDARNISNE